jgi:hypothetical protein
MSVPPSSDSHKFVTVAALSRNRRGVLTLLPESSQAHRARQCSGTVKANL